MVESLQRRGVSGLYEIVDGNRNVFRVVLKELTDWIVGICDSSWFQALGPAIANERSPKFVTVELMTRSPRVADRSLCLLPTDMTGRHKSARYDGARPCSVLHLHVCKYNLNWTRCGTGSQWRRSRSTCLMWSCFLAPTSNHAAVFSTDCRRSN